MSLIDSVRVLGAMARITAPTLVDVARGSVERAAVDELARWFGRRVVELLDIRLTASGAENVYFADGVDDDTWKYHLREGHYSDWFRRSIKDDRMADEAAEIEKQGDLSPRESRRRIRELIERYYTLPNSGPLPVPGKVGDA